jgi:hypothetical protein
LMTIQGIHLFIIFLKNKSLCYVWSVQGLSWETKWLSCQSVTHWPLGRVYSHSFKAFSIVQGILHQFIIPYTPKEYGFAKWKDQTLVEVCFILPNNPSHFGHKLHLQHAIFKTRFPYLLQKTILYEVWKHHKSTSTHLRVFRCPYYLQVLETWK